MDRPFIVVTVSSAVDGRVAINPNLTMWEEMDDVRTHTEGGTAIWEDVESYLERLYAPEADMLGSNSLVKEGEPLKVLPAFKGDTESLYQDFLPKERVGKTGLKKWLIVIDGRGRIRSGYMGDEVNGHYMLHITSNSVSPDYLYFIKNKGIPYIIAGDKQVDLERAMEKLKTKLGIKHLTTTSGGKLGGALLKKGLIDEVNIIFKPLLYGGFNTPSLFDSPDLKPDEQPVKLELLTVTTQTNGHVWIRYKVLKSDV